jgi:hypothetical protein
MFREADDYLGEIGDIILAIILVAIVSFIILIIDYLGNRVER